MRLKINDSSITWPGNTGKKPEGIMIPTHLKVLTIEEKPFVYARKLLDDEIDCADDEVVCPHFNITNGNGKNWPLPVASSHTNRADLVLFTSPVPPSQSKNIAAKDIVSIC